MYLLLRNNAPRIRKVDFDRNMQVIPITRVYACIIGVYGRIMKVYGLIEEVVPTFKFRWDYDDL